MLREPAAIERTLLAIIDERPFAVVNGTAIIIVIIPIEIIVPIENITRNNKPVKNEGEDGSIAMMTAALPANP
tara:strand:- start:185 stop:403 length:219 start_codon:yes stop_codon:yes gene_type:complete